MNKQTSYEYLYSMGNLTLAWRKARKNKTLNTDILNFEKDLEKNLIKLHYELKNKTYKPKNLKTFVLRDPKTRVISKSDFRDRIVHHALILVIGKDFQKQFIYDSCANQIGKGGTFALRRFDTFLRKVTNNFKKNAFCLKADVRHYFEKVDHEILMKILARRIKDNDILWLTRQILNNAVQPFFGVANDLLNKNGMPLGNYTSQFFANVYLHDLDYFVKNILKAKYYIRYVDDFVILHKSKRQLEIWKEEINSSLKNKLKIELHSQKSRIIPLNKGEDLVGFRNFYHYRLLRKRNIKGMRKKIYLFKRGEIYFDSLSDSYQGWQAYAKWADTYKLRNKIKIEIIDIIWNKIKFEW